MTPPAEPKIYHITHVDNLPGILADGGLVSDATMIGRGDIKEGKQAEFLLHGFFRWDPVRRVGVYSRAVQAQVLAALAGAGHQPPVEVRAGEWYF